MPDATTSPRFELDCPNCGFDFQTEHLEEAADVAVGHHDHTGHEPEWVRADWDLQFERETVWEVDCSTCGTSEEFRDEAAAETFTHEHAKYTDHELAADDISKREQDTIDDLESDVEEARGGRLKSLIIALEERNEDGAPYEQVLAAGPELNLKLSDMIHDISKLKMRGEVYEPADGYLRAT